MEGREGGRFEAVTLGVDLVGSSLGFAVSCLGTSDLGTLEGALAGTGGVSVGRGFAGALIFGGGALTLDGPRLCSG